MMKYLTLTGYVILALIVGGAVAIIATWVMHDRKPIPAELKVDNPQKEKDREKARSNNDAIRSLYQQRGVTPSNKP